jgi:hypothetical protein
MEISQTSQKLHFRVTNGPFVVAYFGFLALAKAKKNT